jgi:4-hydroxyphenylpyruvate dioxygenase
MLARYLDMAPSIITPGSVQNGTDAPYTSNSHANFQAFDHVLWYVGNAKQAASYYIARMGFKHVAYVRNFLFLY